MRYGAVEADGTINNDAEALKGATNIEDQAQVKSEVNIPNLSGEWGEPQTAPPLAYAGPGPEYDLTPAAIEESDKWTSEEDNPRRHCKATNIILDYRFDQMVNKIEQSADTVKISYGFMDVERIIHIGGSFPDTIDPSLAGYSVGVWNGDRLEVTTKGFTTGFLAMIGGRTPRTIPHTDEMVIEEVFYVDAAGELVREYTIADPLYLATPYQHLDRSVRQEGQYFPYLCDDLTIPKN
jgi:hypothetical protein